MTGWDGMRDSGEHDFDFAIRAYPAPFPESNVILDADAYNAPFITTPGKVDLPAMPTIQTGPPASPPSNGRNPATA